MSNLEVINFKKYLEKFILKEGAIVEGIEVQEGGATYLFDRVGSLFSTNKSTDVQEQDTGSEEDRSSGPLVRDVQEKDTGGKGGKGGKGEKGGKGGKGGKGSKRKPPKPPATEQHNLVIKEGTIEITENMVPKKTTSVIIPNTVVSIGDNAFADTQLESVRIPDSVVSIGNNAFADTNLIFVDIPKSVTSIGNYAFADTPLTNVRIPNIGIRRNVFNAVENLEINFKDEVDSKEVLRISNKSIDRYMVKEMLKGKGTIRTVIIDDGVESIGEYAFADTPLLTNVSISDSVKKIGEFAFSGTQLTSVLLPKALTTIESGTFLNTPLKSVSISDNVKYIRDVAFHNTRLTSVTIPKGVIAIDTAAFSRTPLKSLTIHKGIQSIGETAFMETNLTHVEIPSSVTNIERYAFANTPLESVTIPDSVIKIGMAAFHNTELTQVEIPDKCEYSNAFQGNVNIIKRGADGPKTEQIQSAISSNHLNVRQGIIEITKRDVPKDTTSVTIPDTVRTIGKHAFANTPLESVNIPYSVETIENGAFQNTKLTQVKIPESVKTIKDDAFDDEVIVLTNFKAFKKYLENDILKRGTGTEEDRVSRPLFPRRGYNQAGGYNNIVQLKNFI